MAAMKACAGAYDLAQEVGRLGHTGCLVPPSYVKPFVKRQSSDSSDAEAIGVAALRPTMHFGGLVQASAALFPTRDLLVRQRRITVKLLVGSLRCMD